MSYLHLRNIDKSFGPVQIIRSVDLSIEAGEFVVFVGPSGCGKSTLLRIISGLESATSGDILLEGRRLNDVEPSDRGVAMVFQSYALYPHMTVRDNMGFSLRVARASRAEKDRKVEAAAEILQLSHLLDRKPTQLSGGQKQRVAIGRAIVREPKIFLFDEPLSNLDAELRVTMRAELTQLHRRLKSTMIYVTHDQVEAMTLADKIVVLKDGAVQQVGAPLALYDDPDNMFVAGFIGTPRMNFLSGTVTTVQPGQVRVQVDGSDRPLDLATDLPLVQGMAVSLGIRPEHLRLAPDDTPGDIPVSLSHVEELGETTYVHTRLADGTPLIALTHGARQAGRSLSGLQITAETVLFFDVDGQRIRHRA
ncbi:MAG: ABC transporter ATP-binding protein [Qingshengfaniella sp.]